jgi:hypothetical protein
MSLGSLGTGLGGIIAARRRRAVRERAVDGFATV